jgi:RNA polymerase sigma-70 factor (ECF subfamily)
MPPEPEGELMHRAIGGDRLAYAELFRRYSERIARLAYLLLHDAASAEDAVQETFTNGLAKIHTWRGDSTPIAWFSAIALNVCRRTLRDRRTHAELAGPEALEAAHRPGSAHRGVVTSVVRRETARRLSVALGFLTDAQREVFVLHYVEGLPYDVIADMLKTTPGAARALAHRGRAVLQERYPSPLETSLHALRRSQI